MTKVMPKGAARILYTGKGGLPPIIKDGGKPACGGMGDPSAVGSRPEGRASWAR